MPPGLTSPFHLLVIIVVALVVLGPEKLPRALRQAGRTMAEVRSWSASISSEVRDVLSLDTVDAEPSNTPSPGAPVPAQVGDGNGAGAPLAGPAAPPATPPAALPSTPQAPESPADASLHPALREGGEWN